MSLTFSSYLNGRGENPGKDALTPTDFDRLVKEAFKTDDVEVVRKLLVFDAKNWAQDCLAFQGYGAARKIKESVRHICLALDYQSLFNVCEFSVRFRKTRKKTFAQ
jgi:hypothetical protein